MEDERKIKRQYTDNQKTSEVPPLFRNFIWSLLNSFWKCTIDKPQRGIRQIYCDETENETSWKINKWTNPRLRFVDNQKWNKTVTRLRAWRDLSIFSRFPIFCDKAWDFWKNQETDESKTKTYQLSKLEWDWEETSLISFSL